MAAPEETETQRALREFEEELQKSAPKPTTAPSQPITPPVSTMPTPPVSTTNYNTLPTKTSEPVPSPPAPSTVPQTFNPESKKQQLLKACERSPESRKLIDTLSEQQVDSHYQTLSNLIATERLSARQSKEFGLTTSPFEAELNKVKQSLKQNAPVLSSFAEAKKDAPKQEDTSQYVKIKPKPGKS